MANPVSHPMRIHFGMISEGIRDGFEDNVVERHFEFFAELLESRPHLRRAHHVEFRREIKSRDRTERFRQAPRDRLPDLREGHVLEIALPTDHSFCGRGGCRSWLGTTRSARHRALDVSLDYSSARAGATDE